MSEDTLPPREALSLSRWSRLKREGARRADVATPGATNAAAIATATATAAPAEATNDAPAQTAAPGGATDTLTVPSLSDISLTSDFRPFMQAQVPAALRQQALKALFRDPHFNAMDGLDTYIDDYTQFDPIAPEVLESLSAWKYIKNPPQQVVTPGGYAVDADSEEGRAVLAARAEAASDMDNAADAAPPELEAQAASLTAPPAEITATLNVHPRHGRRVGEFSPAPDDALAESQPHAPPLQAMAASGDSTPSVVPPATATVTDPS